VRALKQLTAFADRSSLRSLCGHRPRISFDAAPLANWFYPTSRLEQSAIAQHGMHDDREPTSERDTGRFATFMERGGLVAPDRGRTIRMAQP